VTSAAVSFATLTLAAGALIVARDRVAAILHIPAQSMTFVVAYASIACITIATILAGVLLQAMRQEKVMARLSFLIVGFALIYQYTLIRWFGLWGLVGAIGAAEATSAALFGFVALRAMRGVAKSDSDAMPLSASYPPLTQPIDDPDVIMR
jgi:O-antigen/teichoic acid export membrane protein